MSNHIEDRILADADRWGPKGPMGNDEAHARCAPADVAAAVDESMGLQMVSIRLEKRLIGHLKEIAQHHGIGYQPMIRDLLNRFAQAEIKTILQQRLQELEKTQREQEAAVSPVASFLEGKHAAVG